MRERATNSAVVLAKARTHMWKHKSFVRFDRIACIHMCGLLGAAC